VLEPASWPNTWVKVTLVDNGEVVSGHRHTAVLKLRRKRGKEENRRQDRRESDWPSGDHA
jgi:hypothetical protein